jgi:hypothetical protein
MTNVEADPVELIRLVDARGDCAADDRELQLPTPADALTFALWTGVNAVCAPEKLQTADGTLNGR